MMNDDGTMARVPDLERFAARHGLKMVSIARIIGVRGPISGGAAEAHPRDPR